MFTYSSFATGTKVVKTVSDQNINAMSKEVVSLLKREGSDVSDTKIHKYLFYYDTDFYEYAATFGVLMDMKKKGIIESIPLGWNDFTWKLIE